MIYVIGVIICWLVAGGVGAWLQLSRGLSDSSGEIAICAMFLGPLFFVFTMFEMLCERGKVVRRDRERLAYDQRTYDNEGRREVARITREWYG